MNDVEWLNLGVEKKREGKYEEALLCYIKSHEINPNDEVLYKSFGKIYYILGQYGDSAKSYIKSIMLSGCPIDSLLQYGGGVNILMHMGHSLIDSNNPEMAEAYRMTIDPYFEFNIAKKFTHNHSMEELQSYDEKCILTAYKFLQDL